MNSCVISQDAPKKERNYQADNIRFILIVLVVFGHVIKTFSGPVESIIYRIIYSFHMPAFLFLSGCFAHFSPKKMLKRLVFPYVVFQVIYLQFEGLLNPENLVLIQFTTPFHLLWYLFALIVYYFSIPALDVSSRRSMLLIVGIGCLCSVLIGRDMNVGYFLSLSRIVVFFPFFIGGYYCRKIGLQSIQDVFQKRKKECLAILVVLIAALEFYFAKTNTPAKAFYGAFSYYKEKENGDMLTRILFLCCALFWIVFLFLAVPNKQIPVISKMGSNTMAVYLLHGLVRMVRLKFEVLHYSEGINFLLAAGIVAAIMVLLNTRWVTTLFRKLF